MGLSLEDILFSSNIPPSGQPLAHYYPPEPWGTRTFGWASHPCNSHRSYCQVRGGWVAYLSPWIESRAICLCGLVFLDKTYRGVVAGSSDLWIVAKESKSNTFMIIFDSSNGQFFQLVIILVLFLNLSLKIERKRHTSASNCSIPALVFLWKENFLFDRAT